MGPDLDPNCDTDNFLNKFFGKKVILKTKSEDDSIRMKNYPACKESKAENLRSTILVQWHVCRPVGTLENHYSNRVVITCWLQSTSAQNSVPSCLKW